jgi:hypothetical protein
MVSTFAIVVGVTSICILLLDTFLPEAMKQRVESWSTAVWEWLDRAKNVSLLQFLRQPVARYLISAVAAFLLLIFGSNIRGSFLAIRILYIWV